MEDKKGSSELIILEFLNFGLVITIFYFIFRELNMLVLF